MAEPDVYQGPERRRVFCFRCGTEQSISNKTCEVCHARLSGPPRLLPVLMVVVIAASVLSLIAAGIVTGRQQGTIDSVHKLAADSAARAVQADYQQHKALYDGCVRGNTQRVAQVDVILDSADGNEQRAAAWRGLLVEPGLTPSIIAFAAQQIKANRLEARKLRHDAATIADAQRDVSAAPNAADPRERAIVDCNMAFPVPPK